MKTTENTLTQFMQIIKDNIRPPYYLRISTYTNSSGLPKLKILVQNEIGTINTFNELEGLIKNLLKMFDLVNKDEPVGRIRSNHISEGQFYITGKCNSHISRISTIKKGEKNEI